MDDPRPKIRLFIDAPLSEGSEIVLERDAANYLFNVLRLETGAEIAGFNGSEGEWRCLVLEAGKRRGLLRAVSRLRPPSPPPDLWLLFAPLKKARTDFVVEKAVEMGARRLCPVFTRFTNSERVRTDRLRAQAIEAAEQCGLVYVPEIAEPAPLSVLLSGWPRDRRLYFCDETKTGTAFAAVIEPGPGAILVGPEGGFAAEEAEHIRQHPAAVPVSLGPRILRAETAALAALAIWQSVAGDWA
ncbi:MAG: 16S rRNA (uracil(1498)-N(3))-methyltransferase [Pseudomonadota bacterium]